MLDDCVHSDYSVKDEDLIVIMQSVADWAFAEDFIDNDDLYEVEEPEIDANTSFNDLFDSMFKGMINNEEIELKQLKDSDRRDTMIINAADIDDNLTTKHHLKRSKSDESKRTYKLGITEHQLIENYKLIEEFNKTKRSSSLTPTTEESNKDISLDITFENQIIESKDQYIKEKEELKKGEINIIEEVKEVKSTEEEKKLLEEQILIERQEKRKLIETEIVETEKNYVTNIKLLFDRYAVPIEQGGLIPKDYTLKIFKNLNIIISINVALLKELEDSIKDSTSSSIPVIFNQRAPAFKLYIGYINSYSVALQAVKEAMDKYPSFEKWERQQTFQLAEEGFRAANLKNLIIQPIQRLPRYLLLLKELLKYTQEGHPDFSYLQEAVNSFSSLVEYCNEKKHESDNDDKMVKLQAKLKIKDLIQPHRKLLKEGIATIVSSDTSIELYLFTDLFVMFYGGFNKKIEKIEFFGTNSLFIHLQKKDNCLIIENGLEISNLKFSDTVDRDSWFEILNQQLTLGIEKCKSERLRIKDRRRSKIVEPERIIQTGYLTRREGLFKKLRFHTLLVNGKVKYYERPNSSILGEYTATKG
ncbi:hypothetical protein ABK040_010016 [Willaertia magna]